MKQLSIVIGLVLGWESLSVASSYMPTETGNYCVDQGRNFVRNALGPGTKVLKSYNDKARERNDIGYVTWHKTNKCEGYIAVNYGFTRWWMCKLPHYYSVPHYARQAWATGDCKRLLPKFYYNISYEEALNRTED